MIRQLTCIVCPLGCGLEVDTEKQSVIGNNCKRGEVYGIEEVTHPSRVITTTVKLIHGAEPMVPVKTNGAIPKELNFKCVEALNKVQVEAPVKRGDVVIKNLFNTGIDVVASRTIQKA